ncbi:hypothetical protein D7V77_00035 [Corallococcus sp. CA041A]|nr:hypothetical protein D7V77_00035 [Corallococcus sp. CA041A]
MKKNDGWRVPDELWRRIEPLLPARPEQPLGYHNPLVPDRQPLDGIHLVLLWDAVGRVGANTNDLKLARSTLESTPVRRPLSTRCRRQTLCANLGYAFRPVHDLAQEYRFTLRTPRRRSQLSPKRSRC